MSSLLCCVRQTVSIPLFSISVKMKVKKKASKLKKKKEERKKKLLMQAVMLPQLFHKRSIH